MTEELHFDIHQDHREWTSDLEMWMLDLKMWEEEIEALNNSLIYIGQAVEQHADGMQVHRTMLREHMERITKHEKDITYLPEGSDLDGELTEAHQQEARRHKVQRDAHERIKKFHHKVMVLTKELRKSLEVLE